MNSVATESVGDLSSLFPSFLRSLRAADKSPTTIANYGEAANRLQAFLRDAGMPTEASQIARESTSRRSSSGGWLPRSGHGH